MVNVYIYIYTVFHLSTVVVVKVSGNVDGYLFQCIDKFSFVIFHVPVVHSCNEMTHNPFFTNRFVAFFCCMLREPASLLLKYHTVLFAVTLCILLGYVTIRARITPLKEMSSHLIVRDMYHAEHARFISEFTHGIAPASL